MSTTDWNTVTSDLQRAANNLAWFVLESMTIPGQPPPFLSSMPISTVVTLPAPTAPIENSSPLDQQPSNETVAEKKRKSTKYSVESKRPCKIGKAVDRLISETLV